MAVMDRSGLSSRGTVSTGQRSKYMNIQFSQTQPPRFRDFLLHPTDINSTRDFPVLRPPSQYRDSLVYFLSTRPIRLIFFVFTGLSPPPPSQYILSRPTPWSWHPKQCITLKPCAFSFLRLFRTPGRFSEIAE